MIGAGVARRVAGIGDRGSVRTASKPPPPCQSNGHHMNAKNQCDSKVSSVVERELKPLSGMVCTRLITKDARGYSRSGACVMTSLVARTASFIPPR